jgi:hypothetical protein
MTEVNTILKELRKELTEAEYLVDTTCGDTLPHWEGRRDALKNAIAIVERDTAEPKAIANPDAPPKPASIWIEIPITYISSVGIDGRVGPEVYFDEDAVPTNWGAASLPVDLPTAIAAAEMLEAGRQTKESEP